MMNIKAPYLEVLPKQDKKIWLSAGEPNPRRGSASSAKQKNTLPQMMCEIMHGNASSSERKILMIPKDEKSLMEVLPSIENKFIFVKNFFKKT